MLAIVSSLTFFIASVLGEDEIVPVNLGQDVSLTCGSEDSVRWRVATGYLEGMKYLCMLGHTIYLR